MLDALVVGGDSTIGSALVKRLQLLGYQVQGTTRRVPPGDRYFLDLYRPPFSIPVCRLVYLCAAITKFAQCDDRLDDAWRVNLFGTVEVAKQAIKQGAHVVFLSSSAAVTQTHRHYGALKAAAEKNLLELSATNTAVLRFGPLASKTAYADGHYHPIALPALIDCLVGYATDWQPGLRCFYSELGIESPRILERDNVQDLLAWQFGQERRGNV